MIHSSYKHGIRGSIQEKSEQGHKVGYYPYREPHFLPQSTLVMLLQLMTLMDISEATHELPTIRTRLWATAR